MNLPDEQPQEALSLMKQGMKLMSDPRVMKLMQDERVMRAVMQMMAMPGKVQSFTHEQVERLAKSMALATEDEMKDLKRTVRRLEEELARMKQSEGAGAGRRACPRSGRAVGASGEEEGAGGGVGARRTPRRRGPPGERTRRLHDALHGACELVDEASTQGGAAMRQVVVCFVRHFLERLGERFDP